MKKYCDICDRRYVVTNVVTSTAEMYIKDITWHDFSRILNCSKVRLNYQTSTFLVLCYVRIKDHLLSISFFFKEF